MKTDRSFDISTVNLIAFRLPKDGEFYISSDAKIQKSYQNWSTFGHLIVEPLPGTMFFAPYNLDGAYEVKQLPKKYTIIKVEVHFPNTHGALTWAYNAANSSPYFFNEKVTVTETEE